MFCLGLSRWNSCRSSPECKRWALSLIHIYICEKRGFLNGFLCPIYGHGALLVLYLLHGGFQNPVLTFIFGAIDVYKRQS